MVALTAKDLDGTTAMIRARNDDGAWGAWYPADPIETGPTDAAAADRAGTEPIYVGRTKDVQVLLTHKADASSHAENAITTDISAVLIDPGQGPSDAALSSIAAPLHDGGPKVITRAQWGADPSLLCDKPTYDDGLNGIAVHHTAGRNDYTAAESPGIVRAIYAYHAKTLGWCDIGYNALVDKYGQIFEGRAGGLDRPVQGAHAGGFNEHTAGVALMGDFQSQPPTDAAIQAAGRFIGWRAALAGLNPLSNTTLYSQGTSYTKYKKGAAVKLPTIFAHRDVGKTTCPGNAAYAQMDRIRKIAADTASSAGRSTTTSNNAVSQNNSETSTSPKPAPGTKTPPMETLNPALPPAARR
ncbi:N-acetylmuramoyl-L-alanine amidase [Nocardia sp. CA2R105]|nr:N-acetylmuramoyl-L-alanine amidase [Nocardia coffeae]